MLRESVLPKEMFMTWIRIIFFKEDPEAEFKEFEPRLKSAKTQFKLSADLNLETYDTILSGTNHI